MPCQTVQLEMAFMTVERAKLRAAVLRENGQKDSTPTLSMKKLLTTTDEDPVNFFKPAAVGWRHITPGVPPYIDQLDLYRELFKEGFEVAEDDEAGIMVEV